MKKLSRIAKQAVSWLLSLATVGTMLPAMAPAVGAVGTKTNPTVLAETEQQATMTQEDGTIVSGVLRFAIYVQSGGTNTKFNANYDPTNDPNAEANYNSFDVNIRVDQESNKPLLTSPRTTIGLTAQAYFKPAGGDSYMEAGDIKVYWQKNDAIDSLSDCGNYITNTAGETTRSQMARVSIPTVELDGNGKVIADKTTWYFAAEGPNGDVQKLNVNVTTANGYGSDKNAGIYYERSGLQIRAINGVPVGPFDYEAYKGCVPEGQTVGVDFVEKPNTIGLMKTESDPYWPKGSSIDNFVTGTTGQTYCNHANTDNCNYPNPYFDVIFDNNSENGLMTIANEEDLYKYLENFFMPAFEKAKATDPAFAAKFGHAMDSGTITVTGPGIVTAYGTSYGTQQYVLQYQMEDWTGGTALGKDMDGDGSMNWYTKNINHYVAWGCKDEFEERHYLPLTIHGIERADIVINCYDVNNPTKLLQTSTMNLENEYKRFETAAEFYENFGDAMHNVVSAVLDSKVDLYQQFDLHKYFKFSEDSYRKYFASGEFEPTSIDKEFLEVFKGSSYRMAPQGANWDTVISMFFPSFSKKADGKWGNASVSYTEGLLKAYIQEYLDTVSTIIRLAFKELSDGKITKYSTSVTKLDKALLESMSQYIATADITPPTIKGYTYCCGYAKDTLEAVKSYYMEGESLGAVALSRRIGDPKAAYSTNNKPIQVIASQEADEITVNLYYEGAPTWTTRFVKNDIPQPNMDVVQETAVDEIIEQDDVQTVIDTHLPDGWTVTKITDPEEDPNLPYTVVKDSTQNIITVYCEAEDEPIPYKVYHYKGTELADIDEMTGDPGETITNSKIPLKGYPGWAYDKIVGTPVTLEETGVVIKVYYKEAPDSSGAATSSAALYKDSAYAIPMTQSKSGYGAYGKYTVDTSSYATQVTPVWSVKSGCSAASMQKTVDAYKNVKVTATATFNDHFAGRVTTVNMPVLVTPPEGKGKWVFIFPANVGSAQHLPKAYIPIAWKDKTTWSVQFKATVTYEEYNWTTETKTSSCGGHTSSYTTTGKDGTSTTHSTTSYHTITYHPLKEWYTNGSAAASAAAYIAVSGNMYEDDFTGSKH